MVDRAGFTSLLSQMVDFFFNNGIPCIWGCLSDQTFSFFFCLPCPYLSSEMSVMSARCVLKSFSPSPNRMAWDFKSCDGLLDLVRIEGRSRDNAHESKPSQR